MARNQKRVSCKEVAEAGWGNPQLDAPNFIEAIRFRVQQYDLKDKDLIPYISQSGGISEILRFKRKLTLAMIRKSHTGLKIQTESLIQDYELKNGCAVVYNLHKV